MKNIFAEGLECIRKFEEAKEKFGMVVSTQNGYREIALTQQPYIDGPIGDAVFRASGIDAEGTDYEIYWAIKEGMENAEDMQEMCDWDNPAEIVEM